MKSTKKSAKKKGPLEKAIAKSTDLSEDDCEKVVESVFEAITHALVENQSVQIHGFGTFSTRERNHQNEINNEPVFSPGVAFRSAVKKNHHS
ncbi:MAG: HU family DNA-binding protein [Candidatus Omnitrophica bacterium]|nr:HU family DNA-binding protein [Candidatus Omnitrophota bacterium]